MIIITIIIVTIIIIIIEKIKTMNLIWKIELKTITTMRKIAKENNKKLKKKDQIENYYYHWKNKNHILDLKDQIVSHKNFDKKSKGRKLT
jgi:predicted Holliday junction resolvase-like endonuclease